MDDDVRLRWREEGVELCWIANAYLDCAIRLCDCLIDEEGADSVYDNRVVLHLVCLAAELHFKAALAAFAPPYPKGHDLKKLKEAYEGSAACDTSLVLPAFINDLIAEGSDHFAEFPPPSMSLQFERYRYHSDRTGRRFPRLRIVDLPRLRAELDPLKRTMLALFVRLQRT